MSEITLNIVDNSRTINGYVHGSVGEELIATLTAEPETIAEYDQAFKRFQPADSDFNLFEFLYEGFDSEPYDAGILVIDLGARIIACESTYSLVGRDGTVAIRTDGGERFPLPYRLADDWLILDSVELYEGAADERRKKRSGRFRRDYREVLYGGPLFEYIVSECDANRRNDDEDLIVDIHAKWMMTAREDLGGLSPRDALLERHEFIEADLNARELQWAFTKRCPPGLSPETHAYRFAGFGTNEIVIYYDLVRGLLNAAFAEPDADADDLRALASDWMKTPQDELSGRIPAEIIDTERRRINLTVSPAECLVDEECEICQMLAADFDNPMFWGLDGSSMEFDRFEFSFFKSREEFDEDRRRFDEFSHEFEKRYADARQFDEEIF